MRFAAVLAAVAALWAAQPAEAAVYFDVVMSIADPEADFTVTGKARFLGKEWVPDPVYELEGYWIFELASSTVRANGVLLDVGGGSYNPDFESVYGLIFHLTNAAGDFFEGSPWGGALSYSVDGLSGDFKWTERVGYIGLPRWAGDVPEPATWALMLLGFGAVGASMRRGNRHRLASV